MERPSNTSEAATFLGNIRLVDAHHHLWDLARFPYRWLQPSAPPARFGDKTSIRRDYLPTDYLADMAGLPLAASVHVQANCGAADPVDETRWLQDLSDQMHWPTAAIAEVDLTESDAVHLIDRHLSCPILRGFRTPVAWDDEGRWRVASRPGVMSDPAFMTAARHLAGRDLCLEIVVVPAQLSEVAELAAALPELKIVINHFGTLELSNPQGVDDWQAGMVALGAYDNVFLKLSGLWTVDKEWSPDALRSFFNVALTSFGSARMMYGSNLPVEGVNCPAARQFEQLAKIFSGHEMPVLTNIFSRTAASVYRLDL